LAPGKTDLLHKTDPLHIRGVAWNIQSRYRMDSPPLDRSLTFDWRLDVLHAQDLGIDRKSLGLLACTNKCRNNPKTVYFPVMIARQTSKRGPLSVLLRSEVTADELPPRFASRRAKPGSKSRYPQTSG
jgi:hypothetical protein